jgi:putative Mg2+ transporter-C (MgtC) family protein
MMAFELEDFVKILLAMAVGGAVGLEREFRDKAAGFRTLIFICVGATLFALFSIRMSGDHDPTRIAANIVSGVGFLGAGVILRDGGRVIGLTTAATIWLVAALGMGLAGGQYGLVLAVTVVAMIVLWAFPALEHRIDNIREERTYEVVVTNAEKCAAVERSFHQNRLRIVRHRQSKAGTRLVCTWQVTGSPRYHSQVIQQLLRDPEVDEVRA